MHNTSGQKLITGLLMHNTSGIYYQNYVALNNYRNQCAFVVKIWLHVLQYTEIDSSLTRHRWIGIYISYVCFV